MERWKYEGGSEGARERYREERERKGDKEGGKLQGMYPDEDSATGQYTVQLAQNYQQRGPREFGITNEKWRAGIVFKLCIVMRHNVLFDSWMT